MSDTPWLDRLREQVADRDHINWPVVAPALHESGALSTGQRAELELLQLLDEIGTLHTQLQTQPDALSVPPPVRPAEDDETLTTWGRYRLEEKVGRGGFGSVYRAWDPLLEMTVAIKILHRRFNDEHLRDRLIREGRALAQVTHPNVVRVLNVEQNDDRLGLVMEFLRGETLEARVSLQGVMNEREAALVGEDVCRALSAVHAVKLIHRDVKARNIIRDRSGRIVLMDFGAGILEGGTADRAGAEGTPLYMAPEVLRGDAAGMASDVYSVGVLLFYLVTQRYPYEGSTVDDLRRAQAAHAAPSLLELRPDLPLSFATVVARALEREPRDRYPSPAALLQGLVAVRDTRTPWTRLALRGVAGVGVGVGALTLAGMLSAAAFNATLKRADYATESLLDWFEIGLRSMVVPVVLTAMVIGALGLLVAARKVSIASFGWAKQVDQAMTGRCRLLGETLSLHDPHVGSCWLLLGTTIGAVAAWLYGLPLLQALSTDIGTAPAETLAYLSPGFAGYRTSYRMLLAIVAIANLLGWLALRRSARARGILLPRWLVATEIAALVLLYGSMQLPYRLANGAATFSVVEWSQQRCYVLGENQQDTLLFCPNLDPRDRHVKRSAEPLVPITTSDSIFSVFGPAQ